MEILLISHGDMAQGMKCTAEMVCGEQKHVHALGLMDGEGIASFTARLEAFLLQWQGEPLVVLCDIGGGSPYTTCLTLLDQYGRLAQTPVISGMNLPLLFAFSLGGETLSDEKTGQYIEDAKAAMSRFKLIKENDDL